MVAFLNKLPRGFTCPHCFVGFPTYNSRASHIINFHPEYSDTKETEKMENSSIKDLQERAYRQSADKGFHDNEPTEPRAVLSLNAERIALMHSELSEALEELRSGKAPNATYYPTMPTEWGDEQYGPFKPEGVPSELADVVIRILDFCGANDIDLESIIVEKLEYNAGRAHMHGGKKF